jgi:hypothetical protein
MVNVYPAIRLHRTNQAPIPAITPFVYYAETSLGFQVDEKQLFTAVFTAFSDKLAPLSGKGRTFGHYQLRARA